MATNYDFVSKEIIERIFTQYKFTEVMPNYAGNRDKPTGFNNLLGILDHYNSQLCKHLDKYGGSVSTDLSTRVEYMQRLTESVTSSIRMDLQTKGKLFKQTVSSIADLYLTMRDDYKIIKNEYTKDIKGGYPIGVGKVVKAGDNKALQVETEFSDY